MQIRVPRLVAALCVALVGPAAHAAISFSDVSATAGVDRRGESYGASWGDLNGDGFPDLFASNHRQQPSLFLNMGNGTFAETAPNVLTWRNRSRADTHGGTWADYDNDGDLDLMVTTGTGNLSQFLVNENQRLVDRTVELAKQSKKFDWRKLRVIFDSSPLEGAGRVEDTWNLIGRAMSKVVGVVAKATNVDVFQCPCGTAATRRCPRGARPYRRVMLVVAQVSSMKTNRSGSRSG